MFRAAFLAVSACVCLPSSLVYTTTEYGSIRTTWPFSRRSAATWDSYNTTITEGTHGRSFGAVPDLTFYWLLGSMQILMTKYIVSDPQIMGGSPVIKGTRVPIEVILQLLKQGYPLEVIQEDYPHIPLQTLSAAVDEAIQVVNNTLHAKRVSQTQASS